MLLIYEIKQKNTAISRNIEQKNFLQKFAVATFYTAAVSSVFVPVSCEGLNAKSTTPRLKGEGVEEVTVLTPPPPPILCF